MEISGGPISSTPLGSQDEAVDLILHDKVEATVTVESCPVAEVSC